jgi:NADH dehydrogenase FAD-containing subunit
MMDNVQIALVDRLAEKEVKFYPETELTEIKEKAIVVKSSGGSQEVFETDYVVFTEEFVPAINMTPDMINENISTFQVGDCTKPKNIFSAIQQGANAAFELSKG